MTQHSDTLTTAHKALCINLDKSIYGVFAEIGAGQEVARHFFSVGGAAGTVAKTISAYDMTFSDDLYGKSGRYVSKERLLQMLEHEYRSLLETLSSKQGATTRFFVFADTVAALNYQGTNECHGWLGVRFQTEPLGEPNGIILHVRMTDRTNIRQQEALGIIGVNLVYAAYFYRDDADRFIEGLLEQLSIERIEVDMIELSGPAFKEVDNRMMSLKLLQRGLTNAIMFGPDRNVLQPSEELYKHPVLIARGTFRPITKINLDMMRCSFEQFRSSLAKGAREPVQLFEISINNILTSGSLDLSDLFARADAICAEGYPVLISNYPEFYRLVAYLRRYSHDALGLVLSVHTLLQIYAERYYRDLVGGLLEALGRLLQGDVKLYIYPVRREDYIAFVKEQKVGVLPDDLASVPEIVTAEDAKVFPHLRHLYEYLQETGAIVPIAGYDKDLLSIDSDAVLNEIEEGQGAWEEAVPAAAASLIKQRKLFGFEEAKQA